MPVCFAAAVILDRFLRRGLEISWDRRKASLAWLGLLSASAIFASLGWIAAGLLTGTVCFLASFFVQVSLTSWRRAIADSGARLLIPAAGVIAMILYPQVLRHFWAPLADATSYAVEWALGLAGYPVERLEVWHSIRLRHPDFTASIGMGCSGMEGIFFFFLALSVYRFLKPKRLGAIREVLLLGSGACVLWLSNVARIFVFFIAAVHLRRSASPQQARDFFVWAFHENIGWLIYAIVLVAFFAVVERRINSVRASAPAS